MRRVVWLAWLSVVVACCPHSGGTTPDDNPAWRPTVGVCVRSEIAEAAIDDPLRVQLSFTYTWQGEPIPPAEIVWFVPRSRLDASRAAARETIACERMTAPGHEPWIWPAADAVAGPPWSGLADRERVCPQKLASPLNPGVAGLEPAALAAGLAPATGAWQRIAITSGADGGAPRAEAVYANADEQVRIAIDDRIHACTGDPDAIDVLLETEAITDLHVARSRVLSATSAVVVSWLMGRGDMARRRQLVMWIGGRCRVEVEYVTVHPYIHPDSLVEVGRAVDVAQLERTCAAR